MNSTSIRTLLNFGGGLVGIVIIYGIINLFLVGGQSLFHGADKKELSQLKIELAAELNVIKTLEFQLNSQDNELKSLKSNIDSTEDVDSKNNMIDDYNAKLPTYNSSYDDYSNKLAAYNLKVDRANVLAKKIGSTYYVIPIPR